MKYNSSCGGVDIEGICQFMTDLTGIFFSKSSHRWFCLFGQKLNALTFCFVFLIFFLIKMIKILTCVGGTGGNG